MSTHTQTNLDTAFRRVLADHLARYPLMRVPDLYKLIHQAALGSEHAVRDRDAVQRWLDREVQELGAGPDDPLIDPIGHDGVIVRVHLRPFIAANGDLAMLLDAFIRTANEYPGDIGRLRAYWDVALRMAGDGLLPFLRKEMHELWAAMDAKGFPAIHHSDVYEEAYRPAYRVVAREYLRLPRSLGARQDVQARSVSMR